MLAILALAAFFRFYNLEAVPPGLYPDVAINGNDAIKALQTGDFKIFYPENNGREGLFINLIALSFWLLGASVWAIKVVPAVFGLLTVLGIYFLARQLFLYLGETKAKTVGLLAAFFMAISFWHVNFSRLGFRAIMVPFFLVWSFYFLHKALNIERGAKSYALKAAAHSFLAGLSFGLGFHTYIAFRVAPLILLVPIIFGLVNFWPKLKNLWNAKFSFWSFVKKAYFHDTWWRWDVFILTALLAALPLVVHYWQQPADFLGRAGQVSVFSAENPVKTLAASAVKSLGMFNVAGDCNWRHNLACQPQLLWPIGWLFLIGFVMSLVKIGRPAYYVKERFSTLQTHWLLLVWFGVMLLPAVLTNEGLPHSLRSIGIIPPVFIWAGLGAWWLMEKINFLLTQKNLTKAKTGLTIVFLALLVLVALVEFNRYFLDWGQRVETNDAFTQRLVNEGRYLTSLPATVKKFVLVNEDGVPVPYPDGLPMPAQTVIFASQGTNNVKYLVEDASIATPVRPVNITDSLVFLPLRPDQRLFEFLAKYFPNGRLEKINDFEAYRVNF